jgi:hypothetical protein
VKAPGSGVSYSTAALVTALVSSVTTVTVLVAVSNPALMSFLTLAVMPMVGASFVVASNRIYASLIRVLPMLPSNEGVGIEIGSGGSGGVGRAAVAILPAPALSRSPAATPSLTSSAVPPAVQAMAEHVRQTARGMGARCAAITATSVGYGLSRPSPNPFYARQNSLPPWLSGQIAFFLLSALGIETSTYIASYLRFWMDRRVIPTASNPAPRSPARWLLLSRLRARLSTIAERSEASVSSLTNPSYQETKGEIALESVEETRSGNSFLAGL